MLLRNAIFTTFVFVLLSGLMVLRPSASKEDEGGLMAVEDMVKLGHVRQSQEKLVQFELRNTSKRNVEIIDIIVSCSCLKPTIDSRRLGPSEQATLKATWKAGIVHGEMEGIIDVVWRNEGEPARHTARLKVMGIVIGDFVCLDRVLTFAPGKRSSATVRIVPDRKPDIRILDVFFDKLGFNAKIGDDGRSVEVSYDPSTATADQKLTHASLTLVTNSTREEHFRITLNISSQKTLSEEEINEWTKHLSGQR